MQGRSLIIAVSLALAALGAAASATTANNGEQGEQLTEFAWKAPGDLNGTFVATLRFEWEGDNNCTFFHGFAGELGAEHPLHWWSEWRMGDDQEGFAGLWNDEIVQAHAGGVVDTRDLTGSVGAWTGYKTLQGSFSDFLEVTAAGFDLEVWDHRTQPPPAPPDAPFWVELSCQDPFTVASLSAGQEGRSFLQNSMDGGVGASAVGQPTVVAHDGLTHTFESSTVLLDVHPYERNGGLETSQLTLEHPDGTESWFTADADLGIGPVQPTLDPDIAFTGGPGEYTLTLDRVSTGSDIPGILVGLDPVDCLEEAVQSDPVDC